MLKGCFADGPFSFAGDHYTITGHDGLPKPVQRPGPPLFIGGGGRRLLTLAGREADIVGPRAAHAGRDRAARRSAPIRGRSRSRRPRRRSAGSARPRAIGSRRSSSTSIRRAASRSLTDSPRKVAADVLDGIRARTGVELDVDEYLASPHVFIGSVDGLVAKLRELRDRLGISSFMTGDMDTLAPVVERLAGT